LKVQGASYIVSATHREFCIVLPTLARRNPTQPNVAKPEEIHGADARRSILNVNVTVEVRTGVRGPKNILSYQWHRVGRPSVAIHR